MTLFCRHLKAYHIGLSHQRMCVAAYLCEQAHDPTADQIYSALHAEEPADYLSHFRAGVLIASAPRREDSMLNSVKKYLLLFIGTLSLGLGIIGILLPVLPTTPFLLLSSFCYLRSSKRLYNWLIYHRIFGAYLYNYLTYKAVTKRTKVVALIFLWWGLTVSMLLINLLYVRLLLVFIGIAVSIHLLLLKTIKASDMIKPDQLIADNQES